MICPWLKITTDYKTEFRMVEQEKFADCYKDECPWYVPERNVGSLIVPEECKRAMTESNLSKAVRDGYYKG